MGRRSTPPMKADADSLPGPRASFFFFYTQLPFRNGFSPVARCPACSLKRSEILCRENIDAVSGCSAESPRRIRVFFERLFSHVIFFPYVSRAVIQHVDIVSFFSCRRAIKILGV